MKSTDRNLDYSSYPSILELIHSNIEKLMNLSFSRKLRVLQISIAVIYFWFGALKFFTGISPAEALAVDTLRFLSAGVLPGEFCLICLAIWETLIGLMLLFNVKKRYVIWAAFLHMLGTFSPLVIMPEQVFNNNVFTLSLTGQYIIKNLIIFSSLWVLYPSAKSNNL